MEGSDEEELINRILGEVCEMYTLIERYEKHYPEVKKFGKAVKSITTLIESFHYLDAKSQAKAVRLIREGKDLLEELNRKKKRKGSWCVRYAIFTHYYFF